MGTAIKHPVPDRVKPSFVIFVILTLRAERQSARMSKINKWQLNLVWHRMLYGCTHMATMGVKGLNSVTFVMPWLEVVIWDSSYSGITVTLIVRGN